VSVPNLKTLMTRAQVITRDLNGQRPQPTPLVPPNASDAGGSLAGSDLHTNVRHQFVNESQMLEC
jgi:hypothetical protein